ncbi:trypsin-like peptidase domain-containing protein [Sphingomonas sp. ABOLH]|uniref:trypsin-like serine peptidase n=1 Tax=Sphingomonas sp. ABOLH TaxID=1985881 RepID=UPI000F7F8A64|nr:trypsin-like peptidase domain-containing protein [Sphingomonas sp. ABOLH]RSV32163.1 hypothetical protein CA237_03600 [Sphingomonas sp. ABOLH]
MAADDSVVQDGGAWTTPDASVPGRRRGRVGTRSILPGAPERATVPDPADTPWRGVALLNFFRGGSLVLVGTGFLCEPDVILTARHNLTSVPYDAGGVWLGYDARTNGAVQPTGIKAFAYHRELDIGVLVLWKAMPGVFTIGGALPPAHAGVTLAGYSMPYSDGAARCSFGVGAVRAEAGTSLGYAVSTREGDSGAPVFTVEGGAPRAVAVHAEAAKGDPSANTGVRLTAQVVADVATLIEWARAHVGG